MQQIVIWAHTLQLIVMTKLLFGHAFVDGISWFASGIIIRRILTSTLRSSSCVLYCCFVIRDIRVNVLLCMVHFSKDDVYFLKTFAFRLHAHIIH